MRGDLSNERYQRTKPLLTLSATFTGIGKPGKVPVKETRMKSNTPNLLRPSRNNTKNYATAISKYITQISRKTSNKPIWCANIGAPNLFWA
jgi:hypothetical protein